MDAGLHERALEDEEGISFTPRRSARLELQGAASLRGTGQPSVAVTICNISTAGFMAECLRPVLIGSYVSLDLPGIGPVNAQIRWQLGDRMGAKFLEPVSLSRCDWVNSGG